ncbi:MAG: hypothetical protein WBA17_02420 [Saprospiraceae bacterium]
MRQFFSLLCFFLFLSPLTAQPEVLSGTWRGTLTQDDGGFAPSFDFGLELEVKTSYIDGYSFVSVGDIGGEMDLIAYWNEATQSIDVREEKIRKSVKPTSLEWCYKTMRLRLTYTGGGKFMLEGPWEGVSAAGVCIPGYVRLYKSVPRA